MKAIKIILAWIVLAGLLVALVLYILGSFTVNLFDISNWDELGRFLAGFLWLIFSCVLTFIIATTR